MGHHHYVIVMWPFDSHRPLSYRLPIVKNMLSPLVSETNLTQDAGIARSPHTDIHENLQWGVLKACSVHINKSMRHYRNETMFGWLSRRRCFTSVSFTSRTFLTATWSGPSRPKNTAPCEPLPSHVRSDMFSNGISQSSSGNAYTGTGFWSHELDFHNIIY